MIDLHIHSTNVVLPHVFEYKAIDNNDMYNINILDGIECVHTKHNAEQIKFLKDFCKEHNLLMSGGSDFHTDKKQVLGHTALGEIMDEFC